jgi:preprotein translocase subunit YajC
VYSSALAFQNVQPNSAPAAPAAPATPGITVSGTAPADAPAPSGPSSSPMFGPLMMLVVFLPFFFLIFRRNKKEQQARAKLKKGDRISSTSGLVGELVELDEKFAKVKLAPGTTVTMLASAIQPLDTSAPAAAKGTDKELSDLKEAKALAEKK